MADSGASTVLVALLMAGIVIAAVNNKGDGTSTSSSGGSSSNRTSVSARSNETSSLINDMLPSARQVRADYGVPESVTLSQSILETGWGRAAPGYNYFGLKCGAAGERPVPYKCQKLSAKEWENGREVHRTADFRSYGSRRDSARDYGAFLRNSDRFGDAFAARNDPDEFARRLQRGGYSTDPAYADKLIEIMRQENLYRYNR